MTVVQSSIPARQNEPASMSLVRAMATSHARAQRLHGLRTLSALVLAAAGLVAAFESSIAMAVTMSGAAWAVAYSLGLASWSSTEVRRAAVLQEMLDVRLFKLPWNPIIAGEPLAAHEVSGLDRRFRGRPDLLRDYYEIPDLPEPFDVLACQQQNLGWGARIRRRYARAVLAAICAWASAGVLIGVVAGLHVTQLLLRWYIPSLAVLLVGLETYRGQRDIARDREGALSQLRSRIEEAISSPSTAESATELRMLARQVQDLIFSTRCRQTRVPDLFFLRFRQDDSTDFRAAMAELGHLVARARSHPVS